jgi:hypothetical protein
MRFRTVLPGAPLSLPLPGHLPPDLRDKEPIYSICKRPNNTVDFFVQLGGNG